MNETGNRPTRTVHLNTEPTWRGGEQQTLYLLEGLVARGHEVLLCAQRGSPLVERARAKGIDTEAVRMRGEIDPFAVARLRGIFKRFRPEIVHFHTSHAHTLGVAAAALLGRNRPRTLLTRRVDFSIYRHSFFGLNGIKYRHVDHIVAISRAIREVLVDDGLDPAGIDLVPSGIDTSRFDVEPTDLRAEFGLPEDTVILVNVAYFAPHKGQTYLVEATPRILEESPNCALVFIGDGELRASLEARVHELGVSERVFFAGFRTDVPAVLRGSDICVMPSFKEGLGTSVLDALWCGLPVVAAATGGIPEIVHDGENGILVPPRDSEALANAILRLLKDPEERAKLGRGGPAVVESGYTVDQMIEGNIAVYRRMLANSRG